MRQDFILVYELKLTLACLKILEMVLEPMFKKALGGI
jgi:hypothetical protein